MICPVLCPHFFSDQDRPFPNMLENIIVVIVTRTMRETMGEISLQKTSDTKQYLSLWMTMGNSYKEYALKLGSEIAFKKYSCATKTLLSIILSQREEHPSLPILEGKSLKCFCKLSKQRHLIVSCSFQPTFLQSVSWFTMQRDRWSWGWTRCHKPHILQLLT